jgi:hypothetical protein
MLFKHFWTKNYEFRIIQKSFLCLNWKVNLLILNLIYNASKKNVKLRGTWNNFYWFQCQMEELLQDGITDQISFTTKFL